MSNEMSHKVPFTMVDGKLSEAILSAIRPTLRILIVADSEIAFEPDGSGFGISNLIDLLHSPPPPTRFQLRATIQVHLARRGLGNPAVNPNAQRYEPTYQNFRFVMDEFNLDDYHEVWLFGLWGQDHPGALSAEETQVLRAWMDNGGGVFATGDHGTVGAALCKDVPRIRHMRRWASSQNPPPQHGPERHVTTRPSNDAQGAGYETIPLANESDNVPKPISPILGFLRTQADAQGRAVRIQSVHPLLCAVGGPITVLPDHPNEGEVVDFVDIDTLGEAEFPRNNDIRPRPEVVAFARSGRPATSYALLQYAGGDVHAHDFATIGAYDGQQVEVGRAVVDSTIHHWLDQNLGGLEAEDLRKIQAYHLNVAVWLARPEHRYQLAMGSMLTAMLVYPGVVELHEQVDDVRVVGRATLDHLRNFLSPCEVADTVMNPSWGEKAPELEDPEIEPMPKDSLSCPPWEEVMAYTVGGIVESLKKLIAEYGRTRTPEDLDTMKVQKNVEAAFTKGAAVGRKQFAVDLRDGLEETKAYASYVESLGGWRPRRSRTFGTPSEAHAP